MVEDISALGLRHVGYGIPTDLFRAFVTGGAYADTRAGQGFFKQSITRLHFIADKLVVMTLDMHEEPRRMVEDISALGLRHVGYGIPTDLFRAFVTGGLYADTPAGQGYFEQSTTRRHFIADKLVEMTLDMYEEPRRMVEDISALGLRHVGYCIPTDLFGAFVIISSSRPHTCTSSPTRWS